MVDLGSAVGLAISCLQQSGNVDLKSILPALDFYARLFRACNITTICVIFDTESDFFWFGSSLHETSRNSCANRRRQKLDTALLHSGARVTLPVVPPYQQRTIGQFIKNHVVRDILNSFNPKIVDDTKESVVGIHYTKLLNIITKRRVPGENKEPWDGEQWQLKKEAEISSEELDDAWAKIVEGIYNGSEKVKLTAELKLAVKERLGPMLRKGLGQKYGHCAETYPLIFILGLVSFPWLSHSACQIIS